MSYLGHALLHPSDEDLSLGTPVVENRNGLIASAMVTHADGYASATPRC